MQQITTKYNFYVRDAKEVNIPRILNEAPAEVNVILLTTQAKQAVLLARNTWLATFNISDQLHLAGDTLSLMWGNSFVSRYNSRNGVSLESGCESVLDGWRAIHFSKTAITAVLKELEVARAFVPRREVRVSYV